MSGSPRHTRRGAPNRSPMPENQQREAQRAPLRAAVIRLPTSVSASITTSPGPAALRNAFRRGREALGPAREQARARPVPAGARGLPRGRREERQMAESMDRGSGWSLQASAVPDGVRLELALSDLGGGPVTAAI